MNKKQQTYNKIVFMAIVLAIISIICLSLLSWGTISSIIDERDEQLFSLAYSVDRNLVLKLEDMTGELDYMLRRPEYLKIEENLEEGGDKDLLTSFFRQSHLFESSELEGLVVLNSEYQQIYSLNQYDPSGDYQYAFPKGTDEGPFFICYDQNGKYSLALENSSQSGNYLYFLLVDLNHFYETIVPEQLEESNWVVFYDQVSGLLLQNHANQAPWMVLTEEEIQERQDGYSIILKNQQNNTMGAETYTYENYHGKKVPERIITLPKKMTANGHFAIGISRDSETLYSKIQRSIKLLNIYMIAILISGIIVTLNILTSRQKLIDSQRDLEARQQEKDLLELHLKEKELSKALLEAQMQNSIHQLQPHFLYNALSSIREIVLESPEYAADLLLDFTVFLRSCLRAISTNELIPFEQELKNTEAYVNIELMRFGADKLTVEYDIQEKDFSIIPLGLQPLVENAIRHGIGKKRTKNGTVKIQTFKKDDRIFLLVEDNGTGFSVETITAEVASGKRDSTGISNLKKRYKNQMAAQMEIESAVGSGTRVRIEIPT